jgi:hypothetical protein
MSASACKVTTSVLGGYKASTVYTQGAQPVALSYLFPTHFVVTARDSGLFVSAVQPGGPAEGKVCDAFVVQLATSFPRNQLIFLIASLSTPASQVHAADVIMEIDGRLTAGLTAAEGANVTCASQTFNQVLRLSSSAATTSSNAAQFRRCDAQGPSELSSVCSHLSLRNRVQGRNNARHCRQSCPECSCCRSQHDTCSCREDR